MSVQEVLSERGVLPGSFRAPGWLTPFNVVSGAIILAAAVILVLRFAFGLGAVSNIDQEFPWGLWKGFNVMAGVAFAGGAYVLTFIVYILGVERYRPIVRVTVLNGFLAYVFYAGALLLDLGRPWEVMNPIIGYSFGLSSILFLVAWHFLLYMTVAFLEFSPAIAERLGMRRLHRILEGLTVGAVILGITLSLLHQSGLGALFLMAKPNIHPLWYSELIPILFLVSSVFAGMSVVILEGSISRRVFHDRLSSEVRYSHDDIVYGLAKICGAVMFVYLFVQAINFVHGGLAAHFSGAWGAWYLTELGLLTAVPMVLYLVGVSRRRTNLIRGAAVLAILGVLVNRLNVAVIAFKWYEPHHYFPSWMEWTVTAAIICAEIWVFRWAVRNLPVLSARPAWARRGHGAQRHDENR